MADSARPASVAPGAKPVPENPGFWCSDLDDRLAEALIERTLDPSDIRLREMTRDLSRFSSKGQLVDWRPGRDLLCLQDEAGSLLGVFWVVKKQLPERDDYRCPKRLEELAPDLTCAIRTYGVARGRGLLTKYFAEHALDELLRKHPESRSVWYQRKAENHAARALGRLLGFVEVSGEAGGTVIGLRTDY